MNKKSILIALAKENNQRNDISDVLRCGKSIRNVLLKKNIKTDIFFVKKNDFNDILKLKKAILNKNPSCVFNLFEGFSDAPFWEAEFAKIIEMANIPFTGNSSFTLAACLDKAKTKNILKNEGVAVPRGMVIKNIKNLIPLPEFHGLLPWSNGGKAPRNPEDSRGKVPEIASHTGRRFLGRRRPAGAGRMKKVPRAIPVWAPEIDNLIFPVFVKPCSEDASVGIGNDSLVYCKNELLAVLRKRLREFPRGLIVEDFLPGEEYSVAFLGNNPYEVLGVSVINYSLYKNLPQFLTYASKWDKKTNEFKKIMPSRGAVIDKNLKKGIISMAVKAAKALGCRGYFRIDLRAKCGKIFVIDANPNPDINIDSGYVKQAIQGGHSYIELIEKIIRLTGV